MSTFTKYICISLPTLQFGYSSNAFLGLSIKGWTIKNKIWQNCTMKKRTIKDIKILYGYCCQQKMSAYIFWQMHCVEMKMNT